MPTQLALVDLREETRPLRKVVAWKHVARWKSVPLLECGHEGEAYVGDGGNMPKRKRCTRCGAYGEDDGGLKYEVKG
jgi:hypothetical protein